MRCLMALLLLTTAAAAQPASQPASAPAKPASQPASAPAKAEPAPKAVPASKAMPAPKAKPAPKAAAASKAAPAPKAKPASKAAPRGPLETVGSVVKAQWPEGDGWQCAPKHGKQSADAQAWMIKCRRTNGGFFFMVAKVYTVPAKDIRSTKQLVYEVFPGHYARFFAEHTMHSVGAAQIGGKPALSYQLNATHAKKGPIRKAETVLAAGNAVYVFSAEGDPAAFKAWLPTYTAWTATAQFSKLK